MGKMGKRSNFDRNPRDFYPTPKEAVVPLIPHLHGRNYIEPCVGDGSLVKHLSEFGLTCIRAMDIQPNTSYGEQGDATSVNLLSRIFSKSSGGNTASSRQKTYNPDYIITNPPWSRDILHPLIDNFTQYCPTWLLIDADWMHTKQAAPFLVRCAKIVSIGRVKWIAGSNNTGKDNCCWYYFHPTYKGDAIFYGRA